VEAVFRPVKYQRVSTRSYAELGSLRVAVEKAMRDHRDSPTEKRKKKLRPFISCMRRSICRDRPNGILIFLAARGWSLWS
jgi:hypothetical protein